MTITKFNIACPLNGGDWISRWRHIPREKKTWRSTVKAGWSEMGGGGATCLRPSNGRAPVSYLTANRAAGATVHATKLHPPHQWYSTFLHLIFVPLSINVTFTYYYLLFVEMFRPHTAIFMCYSILSRSWCSVMPIFLPMSGCQPCASPDVVLIVSVRL
jgi:hypothetical protein